MLGTGRIMGRHRPPGQLRKKKEDRKNSSSSNLPPSIISGAEKRPDPYALPKKEEQRERKRVVLSKDPLIRIMIEDNLDARYEELRLRPSVKYNQSGNRQQTRKKSLAKRLLHLRTCWRRCLLAKRARRQRRGQREGQSGFPGLAFQRVRLFLCKCFGLQQQQQGAINDQQQTFRSQGGRVTSACLWHAFRAVAIGVLLICVGITASIFGFLDDQRAIEERLLTLNMTRMQLMYAPGILREDRFKLNNLSFAGPVIMGLGGFLIVASCVMTFESRDNAAKVVPSALIAMPSIEDKNRIKALKFRASSSQTTFLDRNIVETLSSEAPLLVGTNGKSVTAAMGINGGGGGPSQVQTVSVKSSASALAVAVSGEGKAMPLNVPSYQASGSSHATTKRASFNGRLPHAFKLEPGLALMDEIGRQALTNAFINFTRNTCNPSAYRDSLIYDGCCVSKLDRADPGEEQEEQEEKHQQQHHLGLPQCSIPKCPSAPNIAHDKLDGNVMDAMHGSSSGSGSRRGADRSQSHLRSDVTVRGQYRVLTPTMYRSRMASTRQALSMDYEGSNVSKFRREGPALRIPSPFQRPMKPMTQDSLEMELGASATGVHTISQQECSRRRNNFNKEDSDNSDCSMVLDLHVEGSAPVTLLVRDESRSTRSTSGGGGNRCGGEMTTTSTTRSHSRSPAPRSPVPSLREQMSEEESLEYYGEDPNHLRPVQHRRRSSEPRGGAVEQQLQLLAPLRTTGSEMGLHKEEQESKRSKYILDRGQSDENQSLTLDLELSYIDTEEEIATNANEERLPTDCDVTEAFPKSDTDQSGAAAQFEDDFIVKAFAPRTSTTRRSLLIRQAKVDGEGSKQRGGKRGQKGRSNDTLPSSDSVTADVAVDVSQVTAEIEVFPQLETTEGSRTISF